VVPDVNACKRLDRINNDSTEELGSTGAELAIYRWSRECETDGCPEHRTGKQVVSARTDVTRRASGATQVTKIDHAFLSQDQKIRPSLKKML
jgi:hypothetical protein